MVETLYLQLLGCTFNEGAKNKRWFLRLIRKNFRERLEKELTEKVAKGESFKELLLRIERE